MHCQVHCFLATLRTKGQAGRNQIKSLIDSSKGWVLTGIINHLWQPCQDTSAIVGLQGQWDIAILLVDLSCENPLRQICRCCTQFSQLRPAGDLVADATKLQHHKFARFIDIAGKRPCKNESQHREHPHQKRTDRSMVMLLAPTLPRALFEHLPRNIALLESTLRTGNLPLSAKCLEILICSKQQKCSRMFTEITKPSSSEK